MRQARFSSDCPALAKRSRALAGLNNSVGSEGSVVFSVRVNDKIAFQSKLMHGNDPAVPVKVELNGAKDFYLEVNDGGDGIAYDQSDWADAKVVLADGKTVWLGDLPIVGTECDAYTNDPICSFTYNGVPSSEFLSAWKTERSSRKLDDKKAEHTVTYTDPKTGLVVRCVGTEFSDFPAVEWVVYFENTSSSDTPILENIQAVDTVLPMLTTGKVKLHWSKGSVMNFEDFATAKSIV